MLTVKGKIKRGKVLAIKPSLSFTILNWDDVRYLCGHRGYFNILIHKDKKTKTVFGIEIIKWLLE